MAWRTQHFLSVNTQRQSSNSSHICLEFLRMARKLHTLPSTPHQASADIVERCPDPEVFLSQLSFAGKVRHSSFFDGEGNQLMKGLGWRRHMESYL